MSTKSPKDPEQTPIKGAVAALLNERELVINRGSVHGVTRGMKFRVLTAEDVQVTDPESGVPLGNIVRAKVRVEASAVQELMTICRTYETVGGGLASFSGVSAALGLGEPIVRTLKTGDQGFLPPISERESYVKVGDRVEQILG
jgi:hypothetical protein